MKRDKSLLIDMLKTERRTLKTWYKSTTWEGSGYIWYGDLINDPEGELLELPFMTYSDYSGSTVERSNCRVWESEYEDSRDIIWKELAGGYGTTGIIAKIDLLTDDMLEALESLYDYPLLDEDDFSELEFELREEALDGWIIDDIRRQLKDDDITDDKIMETILELEESGEVYFICEDAVSAYLDDWEKVVEKLSTEKN